jgi:hypothetical protein
VIRGAPVHLNGGSRREPAPMKPRHRSLTLSPNVGAGGRKRTPLRMESKASEQPPSPRPSPPGRGRIAPPPRTRRHRCGWLERFMVEPGSGGDWNEAAQAFQGPYEALPLPGGEGWGEGEPGLTSPRIENADQTAALGLAERRGTKKLPGFRPHHLKSFYEPLC